MITVYSGETMRGHDLLCSGKCGGEKFGGEFGESSEIHRTKNITYSY